jgi:CRISPR/Cas system CSM-associated protein Csm3 (group 7 of RAMP superfamily)
MNTNQQRFTIELTTMEPFRIGSPKSVLSSIENAVARSGGNVVVQGSSLKGALRAELERYLNAQYANVTEMRPCIPSPESLISAEEQALINGGKYRGKGCSFPGVVCPACYLLGAQGLVGFVRVPYLYTDVVPEEQYSVRVDRARGTVVDKTNRTFQEVPKGVKFSGILEVILEDGLRGWTLGKARELTKDERGNARTSDHWLQNSPRETQAFLKEFVLDRLEAIQVLGGYKSKGLGGVEIKVTPLA